MGGTLDEGNALNLRCLVILKRRLPKRFLLRSNFATLNHRKKQQRKRPLMVYENIRIIAQCVVCPSIIVS